MKTELYHITSAIAAQFPGQIIGTCRNGAKDKGRILSVLSKAGEYLYVSRPDGSLGEKIHIGDGGRVDQAKEQHYCKL